MSVYEYYIEYIDSLSLSLSLSLSVSLSLYIYVYLVYYPNDLYQTNAGITNPHPRVEVHLFLTTIRPSKSCTTFVHRLDFAHFAERFVRRNAAICWEMSQKHCFRIELQNPPHPKILPNKIQQGVLRTCLVICFGCIYNYHDWWRVASFQQPSTISSKGPVGSQEATGWGPKIFTKLRDSKLDIYRYTLFSNMD